MDKDTRRESAGGNLNTNENKIIKNEMFKKINLSKLQFANTFNLPKKNIQIKERRLRNKVNSNNNLNAKRNEYKGRGNINTSTNYECNLTEEKNFSHEVKKNNEETVFRNIIGKLKLGNKFKV